MKGVILAGGTGSRLKPLTNVINKHLLPIFDKPMIHYPLITLVSSGISEVLIITNAEDIDDFERVLGDGSEYNAEISYGVQTQPRGIADALACAENFIDGNNIAVILGDNIFEKSFEIYKSSFKGGAQVFLTEVNDPQRFGIAEIENNQIINIEEKPKYPKSNFAVTGLFFYGSDVFDIIKEQKPSKRNEMEITDVNNAYIERKTMNHAFIRGYWSDAGTFESLHDAGKLVRETQVKVAVTR